jgi:uracil-DNA glycosylase
MINFQNDWKDLLKDEFSKEYYKALRNFLIEEYRAKTIYPDKNDIFNALNYTAFSEVKVVILGQDPYQTPGFAHGLAFSVNPYVKIPKSLQNIFKELKSDLGCFIPNNGYLKKWATQGVMLINTVLTVEEGKSNSHAKKGWETFTDKVISHINQKNTTVVFILWGNNAKSKESLITNPKHLILEAAHPSPLSASKGFLGSKPFSKANDFLKENSISPIDWQIENI